MSVTEEPGSREYLIYMICIYRYTHLSYKKYNGNTVPYKTQSSRGVVRVVQYKYLYNKILLDHIFAKKETGQLGPLPTRSLQTRTHLCKLGPIISITS